MSLSAFSSMFVAVAQADNIWVGNIGAQMDRGSSSEACSTSYPMNDNQITFGGWARERAANTLICFEVYQEGVTEFFRNDIPSYLHVLVYPIGGGAPSGSGREGLQYVSHRGNNAVYALNMRTFDPFQMGRAPIGNRFHETFAIIVGGQDLSFAMQNQQFSVIYER